MTSSRQSQGQNQGSRHHLQPLSDGIRGCGFWAITYRQWAADCWMVVIDGSQYQLLEVVLTFTGLVYNFVSEI